MSVDSTLESQMLQLKSYFSSYLNDACSSLSTLKKLVYSLIEIDLPSARTPQPVENDMISIMLACRRCYEDMKRVQCMLRGHIRGKEEIKKDKSRQSRLSLPQLIQNYSCQSLTPDRRKREQNDGSVWTAARQKLESRMTMFTQGTENEWKPMPQRDQILIKGDEDTVLIKQEITGRTKTEPSNESRVKSVEIIKRIQTLKDSRAINMKNFQQGNHECLGIIEKLKTDLRAKKGKNPQKKMRKR